MIDHMTTPGSGTAVATAGPAVTPASSPPRGNARRQRLSPRETEALAGYARTGDQRQAAATMGVSPQTIKNQLGAAYRKLGVEDAIAAFQALGWLVVPPEERMAIEHDHEVLLVAAGELRDAIDRFAAAIETARSEVAA